MGSSWKSSRVYLNMHFPQRLLLASSKHQVPQISSIVFQDPWNREKQTPETYCPRDNTLPLDCHNSAPGLLVLMTLPSESVKNVRPVSGPEPEIRRQELSMWFATLSQTHCGHLTFPTCRERNPFLCSSPPLEQSYLKLELISLTLLDEAGETLHMIQR